MGFVTAQVTAYLEHLTQTPKTQESDAVLPLGQELESLLGRQGLLPTVANVVAMYRRASGRSISGMTPSPSSRILRQGTPFSRSRVTRIERAPASRLFWTSSASAFLGSGWLSASQRMSSKGSWTRTRPFSTSRPVFLRRMRRGRDGFEGPSGELDTRKH